MPRENNQGRAPASFDEAKSEISDRVRQEAQGATEALHDARDEVTRKAGQYASEARRVLSEKTEGAQRDVGSSLAAFGEALRVASEHLGNADQQAASKFMVEAAGGLDRLSSSIKEKPFGQVLEDVQSFGRQNPGMLLAGSVLAGLALGRFLKASPPQASGSSEGLKTRGRTDGAGDALPSHTGVDGGLPEQAAELER